LRIKSAVEDALMYALAFVYRYVHNDQDGVNAHYFAERAVSKDAQFQYYRPE
jgi:hypothetical protein